MKKLIFILSALLFLAGTTDVQAQWGKKLLKKAGESAKKATEKNVERKIEKAVDKAFDGAEDAVTGKGNDNNNEQQTSTQGGVEVIGDDGNMAQEPQQPQQSLEMTYAKSDFVAGDEIIFDDPMDNEQLGEFPSQWDLLSGYCEVVSINGKKAFELFEWGVTVAPLMKNPKDYLGDVFTIEFDFLFSLKDMEYTSQWFTFDFYKPNEKNDRVMSFSKAASLAKDNRINWQWKSSNGEQPNGASTVNLANDTWQHFAVSFNKRAFKIYVNGVRVMNVPNVISPPGWFKISVGNGKGHSYFTNFRIAKGAVPLYDRMMSDGKFITYGITFDVGKSTIKPESMGEINRIVTLMKENPDLKFSVEGHTDSTGNEASNQTLSEARSNAIVDKLVELGISADRLSASGKGQTSPIADNGTDEGRAKNRRVEFVKI